MSLKKAKSKVILFKKSLPGRDWEVDRRRLFLNRIEYYNVAKRTWRTDLISESNKIKLTRSQLLYLIAFICDSEEIPIPRVVCPARKTCAKCYKETSKRRMLKFRMCDMDVHSILHEIAHLRTCFMDGEKHHSKTFCIYLDYLLWEYRGEWRSLQQIVTPKAIRVNW